MDSLKGSDIEGSVNFFCLQNLLVIIGQSRGSDLEGSVNLFCPHELLVIIGQSQGSDIEGSVDFFCPRELLVINHPNYLEVYLLVLIEQYFPVE